MPFYHYRCPVCSREKEVLHSLDEYARLTRPETIAQTTCAADHAAAQMERFFAIPDTLQINRFEGLSSAEKEQMLTARSTAHYKREIRDRKEQGNADWHRHVKELMRR
jgi:hypothetical protein